MQLIAKGSQIVVRAPAKINLFLEVLGRRADGFHEIETVICTVNLFDTLQFSSNPAGEVHFRLVRTLGARFAGDGTSPPDDVPSDESNLVVQAIELLRVYAAVEQGANLSLHKRIPSGAGLGGGSSDAAAALLAANLGWQLGLAHSELAILAAQLGSDIPFFLYKTPSLCRGRGEVVQPLELAGQLCVVVVKPPVELSSAKVYNNCVPDERPVTWNLISRPRHVRDVRLFNRLQRTAASLTPWIDKTKELFTQLGVPLHQMTGSGSAYFGMCPNARSARRIAAKLRQFQIGDVFCMTACS